MTNLFSEEMRRNPYPAYDQFRKSSPVLHVPSLDFWMLFDYDDVKRVINDDEAFSSSMFHAGRANPGWFIFFDPPRHTKLRALISRAFTPRMIGGLEPRIRELSRGLLELAVERGEMDFAGEFAIPLPMMVIAEMLGIPSGEWARFRQWSDVYLNLSHTLFGSAQGAEAGRAASVVAEEMRACLPGWLDERRTSPRNDLLTGLLQAEVDGEHLSLDEILAFVQLLLIARNETTTNLLNNAMLSLLENPDQLARLRAEPDLLPSAIEETLRYRSPIQFLFRATLREVELHGTVIPANQLLLPMIGSANRDPRIFPDAHRFEIARDPNPHIAFGHGIHFCLGAPLSRLEARIALADVFERVKGVELASDQPWEPRKALHVHGPNRLPVRFEPVRRASAPA